MVCQNEVVLMVRQNEVVLMVCQNEVVLMVRVVFVRAEIADCQVGVMVTLGHLPSWERG